MFVESPLSKQKKAFTVPDRRQCAKACLKELFWEYETNGYFIHRILATLNSIIPKSIQRFISRRESYKKMKEWKNE